MGLTSLQVCMDSSDWLLQGTIHEENNNGMDSSSSPSGADMLTCTMPPAMMDQRRLRPPHDQALKCPRCDSAHTKFCYYNNYSLTQPRYFCKTCRRYWTKGGTLRNIPVGGGCRKNKKVSSSSSKKSSSNTNNDHHQPLITTNNNNQNPEQQRSSPPSQYSSVDFRVSQLNNLLGVGHGSSQLGGHGFSLLGGHETSPVMPIDFMECSRNNLGMASGIVGDFSGGTSTHGLGPNFHGLCSPFGGFSLEGMENYQRLMLPYEGGGGGGGGVLSNDDNNNNYQNGGIDVKPNTKLLSLDNWQDQNQGCSDAGKDYSIGYHLNGLGSWSGMMNNGF